MNRKKNNSWIWIIFLAFFIVPNIDSDAGLVLLGLAVLLIAFAAVQSSRKAQGNERRRRGTNQRFYRPDDFSPADMAKITVYLRRCFRSQNELSVNQVSLRLRTKTFSSLSSLDVYQDGAFLCSLNDYGRRYPQSYEGILHELLRRSEEPEQTDVFDVEAEEHKEEPEPKKKKKNPEKDEASRARAFIDQINQLNQDIPDEEISNGLYETTSLLSQIETLEKKFPDSRDKLDKLYAYYLPILVKILQQYENLQTATMDDNYEQTKKKLTDTIHLINDAMRNIISSMTDSDFINLSADISTLETLLRKDGLTDDDSMQKKGNQDA